MPYAVLVLVRKISTQLITIDHQIVRTYSMLIVISGVVVLAHVSYHLLLTYIISYACTVGITVILGPSSSYGLQYSIVQTVFLSSFFLIHISMCRKSDGGGAHRRPSEGDRKQPCSKATRLYDVDFGRPDLCVPQKSNVLYCTFRVRYVRSVM